jgi:hypothetical protein
MRAPVTGGTQDAMSPPLHRPGRRRRPRRSRSRRDPRHGSARARPRPHGSDGRRGRSWTCPQDGAWGPPHRGARDRTPTSHPHRDSVQPRDDHVATRAARLCLRLRRRPPMTCRENRTSAGPHRTPDAQRCRLRGRVGRARPSTRAGSQRSCGRRPASPWPHGRRLRRRAPSASKQRRGSAPSCFVEARFRAAGTVGACRGLAGPDLAWLRSVRQALSGPVELPP